MLAAVLKGFNQLELEEVPTTEPGPGEVLVRIKSCGFCVTDYKAIRGIRRSVTSPLIPGHEPAGVIAAAGPFVTNRLMARGLVNPEKAISQRFPLS